MCEFFSCIVMKNKKVIWEAGLNAHHEILEKYKINDNTHDQSALKFARVEIIPPSALDGAFEKDLKKWNFSVDEKTVPEWFSPAHKVAAFSALKECLSECLIDGVELDEVSGKKGLFVRNSTIKKLINSTVQEMWNNSIVQEMRSNSIVQKMRDNSIVRKMLDTSIVQDMLGDSTVHKMLDNSTVHQMRGYSTVHEMWNYSTVRKMWDYSTVRKMWGDSTVQEMRDNSIVQEMRDNSIVQELLDASTVQKMWDISTVQEMLDNSTVCVYSKGVTYKIVSPMAVAGRRFSKTVVCETLFKRDV